jgi:hypothetical protein
MDLVERFKQQVEKYVGTRSPASENWSALRMRSKP